MEASGWRAWPPRLPDQPIFLDRTVAWIGGFEAGLGDSITARMRARCEARLGRRTPLGWEVYVKAAALGLEVNELPRDSEMTEDEHRRTIAALRVELMDALGIDEPTSRRMVANECERVKTISLKKSLVVPLLDWPKGRPHVGDGEPRGSDLDSLA